MKTTRRFLTAAISMALALAFLACGDGGGGGGYDDTDSSSSVVGGAGSSSSITGSSSSSVASSSSSVVSGDGSSSSVDVSLIDTRWYDANPNALTFTISTPQELAGLAEIVNTMEGSYRDEGFLGKTVVLANDIDISAYNSTNPFNNARGWIPIGRGGYGEVRFVGKFDGQGHTVSGLYINNTALNDAGLFGIAGTEADRAEIKNLNVVDVNITAQDNVGAVAGHFQGIMENCYSSGTIDGREIVGGLVGNFNVGNMKNNFSASAVNGENSIGGLVGLNSGRVENNYAIGPVRGLNSVGGLVGYNSAQITNSYATGAVIGITSVGGVLGEAGYLGAISNSYSLGTVFGEKYVGGVVGTIYENSKVSSCAALNPNVSGTISNVWRVIGTGWNISEISRNLAFIGMTNIDNDTTWYIADEEVNAKLNGENISISQILADPGMGYRFTEANGWTLVSGKLPGLMGKAVDMPAHLQ